MVQYILINIQANLDSINKSIIDSVNNPTIETKTLSIVELISSGGTGGNIIMIMLGLLSLISVYILFNLLGMSFLMKG